MATLCAAPALSLVLSARTAHLQARLPMTAETSARSAPMGVSRLPAASCPSLARQSSATSLLVLVLKYILNVYSISQRTAPTKGASRWLRHRGGSGHLCTASSLGTECYLEARDLSLGLVDISLRILASHVTSQ
ncbi:hypothetical protein TOPH_05280, partial [Tolypocladium ophioglossoides CBS 100239]